MFQHDSLLQGSKRKKNDCVSIPNVLWEGQGKSTELHIIGKDTLKRLYITSCFQGGKEQCILQKAYHLSYTVGKKKYI